MLGPNAYLRQKKGELYASYAKRKLWIHPKYENIDFWLNQPIKSESEILHREIGTPFVTLVKPGGDVIYETVSRLFLGVGVGILIDPFVGVDIIHESRLEFESTYGLNIWGETTDLDTGQDTAAHIKRALHQGLDVKVGGIVRHRENKRINRNHEHSEKIAGRTELQLAYIALPLPEYDLRKSQAEWQYMHSLLIPSRSLLERILMPDETERISPDSVKN